MSTRLPTDAFILSSYLTVAPGDPNQIDQGLVLLYQLRHVAESRAAVGDHYHVGLLHDLFNRGTHERGNVWKFPLQAGLVRPNQPVRVHVLIVNAHLVSSANQGLDHRNRWAFADVVGAALEAQAQDAPVLAPRAL